MPKRSIILLSSATRRVTAQRIDEYAVIAAKIAKLEKTKDELGSAIKAAGGGQSAKFKAVLERVKAHVSVVPAHDRLRVRPL